MNVNWSYYVNCKQSCWNIFELNVEKIIDKLAPLTECAMNIVKEKPPKTIKI